MAFGDLSGFAILAVWLITRSGLKFEDEPGTVSTASGPPFNVEQRFSMAYRHQEEALDTAALLLVLSRGHIPDPGAEAKSDPIADRLIIQMTDLLHHFAYHARKAIELAATTYAPQIMAQARVLQVACSPDKTPSVRHRHDLLWVLGRVIHSQEVHLHFRLEPSPLAREAVMRGDRSAPDSEILEHWIWEPRIFSVRSDQDAGRAGHEIEIRALVDAFNTLQATVRLVADLAAERMPDDPGEEKPE